MTLLMALVAVSGPAGLPASVPGTMVAAQSGSFPMTPEAVAGRIDQAILQMEGDIWRQQNAKVEPAQRKPLQLPPQVSDEVFIRRACLDLHARLPDAATVRAFLVSTHPQKRQVLVDRLLKDPMSGARRFLRLADMLRVKDAVLGYPLRSYVEWLRAAAANDMPYDRMVRALLTSSGEIGKVPAAGFLMTDGGHMEVTMQEIVRVFLDENIQCATCHDHPFADTTQMQYYQLAASLTGVEVTKGVPGAVQPLRLWPGRGALAEPDRLVMPGEQLTTQPARTRVPIFLPNDYLYRDGKPGDAVKPGLPAWTPKGMGVSRAFVPAAGRNGEVAVELAEWVIGSARFAEVAALRTWQELFGLPAQAADVWIKEDFATGKTAVEVYQSRSCEGAGPRTESGGYMGYGNRFGTFVGDSANEPHRRFTQVLAAELVRMKYDLREFERALCHTQAYQRQAQVVALGEPGYAFSPAFRRLPAETIWNNLVLVQTDGAAVGKALLSHELPQVPDSEHPSRALGRADRAWGDDSLRTVTHRLVRTLMTGDTVKRASAQDGPLVQRLKGTQPGDLAVEEAFLAVLGRLPTNMEKMTTLDYCLENPGSGLSDTVWSLLNTSEFVFQY